MTYRLIQLAPGSFDVAFNHVIIASLVQSGQNTPSWIVELLVDPPPKERRQPFTEAEHTFATFDAACRWLGNPELRAR